MPRWKEPIAGAPKSSTVTLWRPGVVEYDAGLQWQHAAAEALAAGTAAEHLALLQHGPVYTLGARGRLDHVIEAVPALEARGARVVRTDRGGDVTFHGPGQIVGYPILDLRGRGLGAADYVRRLEGTIIEALAALGCPAERVRGRPGVWIDGAKIAAVGVRVSRGITRHGFAVNVSPDLSWFEAIVPCGIADAGVTSLARELGEAPSIDRAEHALCAAFEAQFNCVLEEARAAEEVGAHAG